MNPTMRQPGDELMGSVVADPAELVMATESLLTELAALADEHAPSPRAAGVGDRERAQAFLLALESGSPLLADLRHRTPGSVQRLFDDLLAFALSASGAEWAALCIDCAAPSPRRRCADCLEGVNPDLHDNPLWPSAAVLGDPASGGGIPSAACVSCGVDSPRRYCVDCARQLSVEPRENPSYQDLAERGESDES